MILVEEINDLRDELNKQVENCNLNSEMILALSQHLDVLITEYYRHTGKTV